MAQVLRWKILKHYEHHARMNRVRKDLILAIESLINVARLAWESRSIPGLCIFCIAWVGRPFKVDLILKVRHAQLKGFGMGLYMWGGGKGAGKMLQRILILVS